MRNKPDRHNAVELGVGVILKTDLHSCICCRISANLLLLWASPFLSTRTPFLFILQFHMEPLSQSFTDWTICMEITDKRIVLIILSLVGMYKTKIRDTYSMFSCTAMYATYAAFSYYIGSMEKVSMRKTKFLFFISQDRYLAVCSWSIHICRIYNKTEININVSKELDTASVYFPPIHWSMVKLLVLVQYSIRA